MVPQTITWTGCGARNMRKLQHKSQKQAMSK
jgi:hypothetical protein